MFQRKIPNTTKKIRNTVILLVFTLIAASCVSTKNDAVKYQNTSTSTTQKNIVPSTLPLKETTSQTTTTTPQTTTTTPQTTTTTPQTRQFDIVVVGDTAGAVVTAVTAAEMGASVVMLANTGYFGGQTSASGVSTMDQAGIPLSGKYAQLISELEVYYDGVPMNKCYYSLGTGLNENCPDPLAVKTIFERWLNDANVEIILGVEMVDAIQAEDLTVLGVIGSDEIRYMGLVACGDEFGDCYTHIEGLKYATGNGECTQKTTWATIMNWYPNGRPQELSIPKTVPDDLRVIYGNDWISKTLALYRAKTTKDGITFDQIDYNWSERTKLAMVFSSPDGNGRTGYRGMADNRPEIVGNPNAPAITRTGINDLNDSPISTEGFENTKNGRIAEFTMAQNKTYLYLWYLEHELEIDDWGLANDLQFDTANRIFNNPTIPDEIEKYFTPMPYVREGRRLVNTINPFTWENITNNNRRTDQFANSVMIGNYMVDQHGCAQPKEERSRYGNYDVPLSVFIPTQIDGFLPALVRAAGLDRATSSSLRMQPTEINGGQVVGVILALAIRRGEQPRDVPINLIRASLCALGAIIDVPEAQISSGQICVNKKIVNPPSL